MGRFLEAFARGGERQAETAALFPDLVKASALTFLKPDSDVSEHGVTFAIGVAVWSAYDMRLLDELDDRMAGYGGKADICIAVFDFGSHWADLDRYIPTLDITQIFSTPVVGEWRDGALVFAGAGAAARTRMLADLADVTSQS